MCKNAEKYDKISTVVLFRNCGPISCLEVPIGSTCDVTGMFYKLRDNIRSQVLA